MVGINSQLPTSNFQLSPRHTAHGAGRTARDELRVDVEIPADDLRRILDQLHETLGL